MIPEAPAGTSVCVSVVVHESELDCLASALTHLFRSLSDAVSRGLLARARVTLHDNGSSPEYQSLLNALHQRMRFDAPPWLEWTLCLSDENPGFGSAHNQALGGIAEAYLLILNPDVELAPDAIGAGLEYLGVHESVVALNPRCDRADGGPEFLCKRYPSIFDLLLRGFAPTAIKARFSKRLGRYEYRDTPRNDAREVELLSGACLLCRREAFHRVGGFDDRYFLYFEDFDLALRLRAEGALHYEPSMGVIHYGGFAAQKGWRHRVWFIRSAIRFFATHGWRLR